MAPSDSIRQLRALCQRWREDQAAWEREVVALEQEPPVAKEKANALAERIKTSSAALLDEAADICGYSRQPNDSRERQPFGESAF
jgi:hypothetical protein